MKKRNLILIMTMTFLFSGCAEKHYTKPDGLLMKVLPKLDEKIIHVEKCFEDNGDKVNCVKGQNYRNLRDRATELKYRNKFYEKEIELYNFLLLD